MPVDCLIRSQVLCCRSAPASSEPSAPYAAVPIAESVGSPNAPAPKGT